MYNLLVSGEENAWNGKMYSMPMERCVREGEYTPIDIAERLGTFTPKAVDELKSLPCLFANEGFHGPPKFGWLKNIKERSSSVVLEFQIERVDPWISAEQFHGMAPILDIVGWESSRTHWAVKDVDLVEEFKLYGVVLPVGLNKILPVVSPTATNFDVAFSFPGESRPLVEAVLKELKQMTPASTIFYDYDYQAFLARPDLDIYLGNIYRDRAKMLVVFLSGDYQKKRWCGVEWRVIREVIYKKEQHRVMYIKTDDGDVDGVLATDGYIDAKRHSPQQIAYFIYQRIQEMKQASPTI